MEYYIRECPSCFNEIKHKTKRHMMKAKEKESLCRSCCNKGTNNPFYGKTHKKESIDKIINNNLLNVDKYKTNDFRNKISKLSSGENNPMFGKSFYSVWVEKYGVDIADDKMKDYKNKQSDLNKGSRNNMFGKPSPPGSGNGWSGWYKGKLFRSLKELSCMLTFESSNLDYESAEKAKFRIKYVDWDGKHRNYYPDFFISSLNKIIECKPISLVNSLNVQCKMKYAEEFCKKRGYKYEFLDPIRISSNDIKKLYNNGDIKFIDRYELKYKELYN
jgi:hypothetical protein